MSTTSHRNQGRLLSLDFLRGLIMVLLALESAQLYKVLTKMSVNTPFNYVMEQFDHQPWSGLHFWDLIQPGFMFMAGVAMAYSLTKQQFNNVPYRETLLKTLKRSAWLLFWGVLINMVRPKGLEVMFTNVLAQMAFTTLIAFLIFKWRSQYQLVFCVGLLLLTEVLYRFTNIPGFDQPFTDQHNFGNYLDWVLLHKVNPRGWVTLNFVPTAVHTILGILTGKLLLSNQHVNKKIKILLIAGIVCLFLGYSLDFANITPIIKRIATSSFTLVSGGWCLLALLFCYWYIDLRNHRKNLKFFLVIGMNSIFIYLFFEIVGHRWFNGYIFSIVKGLAIPFSLNQFSVGLISSMTIFFLEWGLCYFLYRKKIFFKL